MAPLTSDYNDDDDENNEYDVDDTPLFLTEEDAVEVPVDDNDVPMDDDDDDDDDAVVADGGEGEEEEDVVGDMMTDSRTPAVVVVDTSVVQIRSHVDAVYAVATYLDAVQEKFYIVTGGGDDKAFLHHVSLSKSSAAAVVPTTTTFPLEHAHTDSVSAVAFNMAYIPTADAAKVPRLAAVGAYDGSIVLYNVDTGVKVHAFDGGPTDVEWLSFHSLSGTVLLAGSSADGTVWMYHCLLKTCLQVFVGHESAVTAGTFSANGKLAITTSADGTARVWAPKTGLSKHVFLKQNPQQQQHDAAADALPGLTSLAVGGGTDGHLFLVGAEDGAAHVCHAVTKKIVATLRHSDPLDPSRMNNNNSTNNAMQQDDDEDDDEEQESQGVMNSLSVEAVGFASASVNPNWCATGGLDGLLKIWDLTTQGGACRQVCRKPISSQQQVQQQQQQRQGKEGITRLTWHPTLPIVFCADTAGTVHIWDARNGTLLKSLTGHEDIINDMSIAFVPDGSAMVATASDDHTVRLFHVPVQELLLQ